MTIGSCVCSCPFTIAERQMCAQLWSVCVCVWARVWPFRKWDYERLKQLNWNKNSLHIQTVSFIICSCIQINWQEERERDRILLVIQMCVHCTFHVNIYIDADGISVAKICHHPSREQLFSLHLHIYKHTVCTRSLTLSLSRMHSVQNMTATEIGTYYKVHAFCISVHFLPFPFLTFFVESDRPPFPLKRCTAKCQNASDALY